MWNRWCPGGFDDEEEHVPMAGATQACYDDDDEQPVPDPARNLKLRVLTSLSQPPAIGEVSSFFAQIKACDVGRPSTYPALPLDS